MTCGCPQTTLGAGRLLAQPRRGVLQWLNASAAELWDRFAAESPATARSSAAQWLSARYGLAPDHAAQAVAALFAAWRQAGLLDPAPDAEVAAPWQNDWVIPAPPAIPADAATRCVELAGLPMGLRIDDATLGARLDPVLHGLYRPEPERHTHVWHLAGIASDWRLTRTAQPFVSGQTVDSALTTLLSALVNHACQAEDRLLVVHGAGLVGPDGRALLLIAPGGSGKTTLAAALNAEGMALLSDDVAPVRRDGRLLALNTPLCLKPSPRGLGRRAEWRWRCTGVPTSARTTRGAARPHLKKTPTQSDLEHWRFGKLRRRLVSWFTRGRRRLKRGLQNGIP